MITRMDDIRVCELSSTVSPVYLTSDSECDISVAETRTSDVSTGSLPGSSKARPGSSNRHHPANKYWSDEMVLELLRLKALHSSPWRIEWALVVRKLNAKFGLNMTMRQASIKLSDIRKHYRNYYRKQTNVKPVGWDDHHEKLKPRDAARWSQKLSRDLVRLHADQSIPGRKTDWVQLTNRLNLACETHFTKKQVSCHFARLKKIGRIEKIAGNIHSSRKEIDRSPIANHSKSRSASISEMSSNSPSCSRESDISPIPSNGEKMTAIEASRELLATVQRAESILVDYLL